MNQIVLSLDIGGTWIKGAAYDCVELSKANLSRTLPPVLKEDRTASCLSRVFTTDRFSEALKELIESLILPETVLCSIAISTAGVVDYAGSQMRFVAPHLSPLKETGWIEWLKKTYGVPVMLINDANAAMIGAAALGYLEGYKTVGVMPVGTGLGFTVWRNGRIWTPHYSYTLLGCIETPSGSYDQWASIPGLAKQFPDIDLTDLFGNETYWPLLDPYLDGISRIIRSACYMYHTEEILVGGGLADLVVATQFPLAELVNKRLAAEPLVDGSVPSVRLLWEGNRLPLFGAALLGDAEAVARRDKFTKPYAAFTTEKTYDSTLHLESMDRQDLIRLLWKAEQEAGSSLESSLDDLSRVAGHIVQRLASGGRLIYVGAGTSGRLAAVDTVEIACTFGFPRERVLTFIAGGVADASIEIETGFEEDASCIPEMLTVALSRNDIVIGISVSGSAYYVQSALAYARKIGALSVIIQEEAVEALPFCDQVIPLRTGPEIITGSTRMKAGTATKKVLNFLSTTAMISLGKVHGCYMTELECINEKLIQRAIHILKALHGLQDDEGMRLLKENHFLLNKAIESKNAKL